MFATTVVLPPTKPRALPTLIVALHRTCPCPRVCAPDLNRLARELAPVARAAGKVDEALHREPLMGDSVPSDFPFSFLLNRTVRGF